MNVHFILNRPNGPPCTVILFAVPFYGARPSCTKCLPIDSRLTRNVLDELIVEEVDGVEESVLVAIALVSIDSVVVIATLVALCLKKYSAPAPNIHLRDLSAQPRRDTLHEESLSVLRYSLIT